MACGEEEEGRGDPDPSNLDKIYVEDVRFLGEVAGRIVWRIALECSDVRSDVLVDGQGAEERAQD